MKILICDDERLVRTIISATLKSERHRVELACDGQEALENIQANPEPFDLLITDNRMPRLTGLKLIQKLRALNIPLKVIMITGSSDPLSPEAQQRLQVDAHLPKPFSPPELLECVNNLVCVH